MLGMSKSLGYYYIRKTRDATFHPGKHGGLRANTTYSPAEKFVFELAVAGALLLEPQLGYYDLLRKAQELAGTNLSRRQFSYVLKKWNFSWKYPGIDESLKFTPENMEHWRQHVLNRKVIPDHRVVYLDECHFNEKSKLRQVALMRQTWSSIV
jgi:hypothetical protein